VAESTEVQDPGTTGTGNAGTTATTGTTGTTGTPDAPAESVSVSEYTTQTSDAPAKAAARKPVVTGNALGTGRRKEAIARVRPVADQRQVAG
jgi:hypothetical protein